MIPAFFNFAGALPPHPRSIWTKMKGKTGPCRCFILAKILHGGAGV
ncbi:hypothetical protein U879_06160 [Defluviimonas sp. 20V17]|uniref:Uncharacterized protein n=1 Tax=Allgaiera indica TaxID=765699 RepID=A0A1H2RIY6_9RHOB|nr:hypothetical protein U879_06160 [Defluviimonas sp. 20V17]SDW19275.1 hypothetical protein SAMN05444006_10239 [Allgaiera indica]